MGPILDLRMKTMDVTISMLRTEFEIIAVEQSSSVEYIMYIILIDK